MSDTPETDAALQKCWDANGEPYADHELESMVDFARRLERERNALRAELERNKPDKEGWIPHKPGDPMPSVERVRFKCRDGSEENGEGQFLEWGKLNHTKAEIIAWKPA